MIRSLLGFFPTASQKAYNQAGGDLLDYTPCSCDGLRRDTMIIRAAQPADAPDIGRVVVDSWRTTYRGIIPDAVLDNLSYEDRAGIWVHAIDNPASVVYVAATPAGEIVGAATGGPAPAEYPDYQGELQAIYL